ncbi:MAG: outer membrane beta-barrel protein [Kangiellaceae bacterium]|nr:outer membrane beta-barrel protein [Kangiellaceae bacterium]
MRYLILIAALITTTMIHAREDTGNKHTYGVSLYAGYISNKLSRDDDTGITLFDFFYEYHFNKNFSVNGKYYTGSTTKEPDVHFALNGFQLSLKAKTAFTSRYSAYGRFGANIYSADDKHQRNFVETDNGVGVVAAAGVEFNADNGFTSAVEFQYLPMDFFDSYSLNFSVGYSF